MNNYWAFLPMRSSTELLGDADALRQRLAEEGYLYLEGVLDRDKVLAVRNRFTAILAERGWVKRGYVDDARSIVLPLREDHEDFQTVYDEVQRVQEFHELAHDASLLALMRDVLGESAFPHPLKIVRMSFPENYEVSTPPHQDYPNNQGTKNLTATWIPLGDISLEMGGLAILRGSNRYGVLPLDIHPGPGNRQAVVPLEMLEELRWVTAEFSIGDVLVFPSTTVHASLHNVSDSMRLSVDFRYQLEGEALTDIVLHPHFQRQDWDEVYAGWTSTELQYYWRDLDYELVPFEQLPLVREVSDEMPWAELLRHDRRVNERHARRMARIGEPMEPDPEGAT
jgi:ectoine hydroxylase-related dioxygenase (phytanoyl-CoA dioxygenase family)